MRNFKDTAFYNAVNSENKGEMNQADAACIFSQFKEELFEFIESEADHRTTYRDISSAIFDLQSIAEKNFMTHIG